MPLTISATVKGMSSPQRGEVDEDAVAAGDGDALGHGTVEGGDGFEVAEGVIAGGGGGIGGEGGSLGKGGGDEQRGGKESGDVAAAVQTHGGLDADGGLTRREVGVAAR